MTQATSRASKRSIVTLVTLLAALCPVAAQYPPGGQYPGGTRYPGSQYPGGIGLPIPRRDKGRPPATKDKAPARQTLTGVLRRIDEKSLEIASEDTRVVTIKYSEKTQVLNKGETVSARTLKPGDLVRIEATQDDQGIFSALQVVIEKEGSGAPPPPGDDAATAEASARIARQPVTIKEQPDPCDPGKPHLKRGKPEPKTQSPEARAAGCEAADTPPASARAVVPAQATVPRRDPVIEKARAAILAFTGSLPNYMCQEQIARYVTNSRVFDWQAVDLVSADVVYEDHRDQYHNIKVNGKAVNKRMEDLGGAWSTGEFGTMALDLFTPGTGAEFGARGPSTASGRVALVYDFEVERDRARWHIQVPGQSISPAYHGSVWIDKETARILRIEMQATDIPKTFPLDKVESAIDYDFVRIGEGRYLLPVHAESLMCQRGANTCNRNTIDFRNYRRYSGQATITYD